jgi:hypothetical protein
MEGKSCMMNEICVAILITIFSMFSEINNIQVVPVLRDFVLRDFALTRLENLRHFSNLRDNFRFNAIWHGDPWSHLSSVGG